MRISRIAASGLAVAVAVAAGVFFLSRGSSEPAGYGVPGDPAQPARTLEILIRERPDGRMYFLPDAIEVRRGEQVRFLVKNEGERPPYVLVAPTSEITRASAQLRNNPRGTLAAPNAAQMAPGQTNEVFWRFTRAGELEFSSVLPGDREAGLYGRLVVR